jgi:hypothetical protein
MRSRKLLALLFCLITFPAIAGYMTLLGAGVGSIAPVVSWVSTTDPTFPSSSLTYSGPSLSTMFDSTGNLTYAPNNLLLQSNTFSNAAWTLSTATLSSGVTDPLGGANAWTLTATGAGALVFQNVTVPTSANGLFAIYVKRRTGSGAISLRQPAGAYSAVTVTGSWTQVSVVGPGNGAVNIAIQIATSGDAIDIYAATLSAVTYETTPRTADQVITTASAYYGPRIDYDPNTLAVKGLLIEEARTNYAYQAFNLSDAGWAASGGSKASATDLSGGSTATTFTPSAVASTHYIRYGSAGSLTNAVVYTMTAFVKFGGAAFVWIGDSGGTSWVWGSVNTSTLAVATSGTVSSSMATPVAMGGGVYKLQLTWTRDLTAAVSPVVLPYTATANGYGNVGYPSWTPAGTESITVLGVQIEAGTFGTSPIPTAAASVTRAADVVQFTGAALTALQGSAGSAAVEHTSELTTQPGTLRLIGTTSSRALIYGLSDTSAASWNGSVSLNATIGSSGKFSTTARTAAAWSAAGRSIVANGGTVATDANAAFGGVSPAGAWLGSDGGTADWASGWYKSFALYNQRLPDATLQAKSVVGASYAANDNGLRFAFADNDNLPIHWRVAL